MNRQIEFRAWDKVKKKMYRDRDVGFIAGLPFINTGKSVVPFEFRDRFEFMQYTGLLDKNGVKIFEGDLIRSYHQRGKVIDCNGAFGCFFNPQDFTSLFLIFDRGDGHKVEVIGNIFESSELLEEK